MAELRAPTPISALPTPPHDSIHRMLDGLNHGGVLGMPRKASLPLPPSSFTHADLRRGSVPHTRPQSVQEAKFVRPPPIGAERQPSHARGSMRDIGFPEMDIFDRRDSTFDASLLDGNNHVTGFTPRAPASTLSTSASSRPSSFSTSLENPSKSGRSFGWSPMDPDVQSPVSTHHRMKSTHGDGGLGNQVESWAIREEEPISNSATLDFSTGRSIWC